jgi:CRISPR type III-A-associated RAMP protein Csm5
MADFIATTLSELHIGSGQRLLKNMDFALRKIKDTNYIGVIDIKKLSEQIGIENIEKLIGFIDKKGEKNLFEFLKTFKEDIKLKQISKRLIQVYGNFSNKTELKEFLINSENNPFIPGSSLKGAIRTAIIDFLVQKNKNIVRGIIDNAQNYKSFATWQQRDFQNIETKIVNKLLSNNEKTDANSNIMRFLQVGDIEFKYETSAVVLEILNFYYSGWDIKQGQSSLIEVLLKNCESEKFRININSDLLELNLKNNKVQINKNLEYNFKSIFEIINNHTKKNIEKELSFWKSQNTNLDKIQTYISTFESIFEECKNLKDNEFILKLGGNSGWTSITGGWAKYVFSEMEWDKLYHLLNKGRKVDFFPKTRKIDQDGDLMGFVKISKSN